MIVQDLILIIFTLVCLILGILLKVSKNDTKLLQMVYFLPMIGSILHRLLLHNNYLMYPIYFAALLCMLCFFVRKKTILYGLLCVVVTAFNLVILIVPSLKKSKCYASLNYLDAFLVLFDDMKENYALSGYKETDFDALLTEYEPRFEKALEDEDKTEYINAMVDYVNEFNDGHVALSDLQSFLELGASEELSNTKIQRFTSCYSMSIIKLDSGKYIAVNVQEDGVAYQAGIREGNEILLWNGKPVNEQASKLTNLVPVRTRMYADQEIKERFQPFFLPCMSEDVVDITFLRTDGAQAEVTMNSEGNGYLYLKETIGLFSNRINDGLVNDKSNQMLTYKIDDDLCYIRFSSFVGKEKELEKQLEEVSSVIEQSGVNRVIVDVRNNSGGSDELGALAVSYFAKEDGLYLQESHYDPALQTYHIENQIPMKARNKIKIPVILLINSQCISAGEGFAYHMAKLDQVTVVGMTGTNGSFGSFNGIHIMPEHLVVIFPDIACLDEAGNVMIDSGVNKVGGVKPEIRIPIDENAAKILFTTQDDYELDYAKSIEVGQ